MGGEGEGERGEGGREFMQNYFLVRSICICSVPRILPISKQPRPANHTGNVQNNSHFQLQSRTERVLMAIVDDRSITVFIRYKGKNSFLKRVNFFFFLFTAPIVVNSFKYLGFQFLLFLLLAYPFLFTLLVIGEDKTKIEFLLRAPTFFCVC